MTLRLDTEGLHPATDACLEALDGFEENFAAILDIGCGNGILSLVSASLWPDARVLAADISPKAVNDTRANAASHGLDTRVTAIRSDGFAHPEIHARAPYDLILCNLLAEELIRLGQQMRSHLRPMGWAVIGGVLAWKAPETERAYQGLGFEITKKIERSPWRTLVLCLSEES